MSRKDKIYITAIIPAHNEEAIITRAIASIKNHVNKIVVACDNCTDNTRSIAIRAGANIVFNTVNNHHRKAGALNQALENYVNWSIKNQYLLIMDADTEVVAPKLWFTKAKSLIYPNRPKVCASIRDMTPLQRHIYKIKHPLRFKTLTKDKAYDCVGSIFQAPQKLDRDNYIEEGQRLEWLEYRNKTERTKKVSVLTGTCSLISSEMLCKVQKLNGNQTFYNEHSITEDFAMTVTLKECHARMISPSCCLCKTATKPDATSLIHQRRRWDLGALDLVFHHNIDEVTLPYIGQQIMLLFSNLAYFLSLAMALLAIGQGTSTFKVSWILIFLIFDIDQTMRIWKYGNHFDRLYTICMYGILLYSIVLGIAYFVSVKALVSHQKIYWNQQERVKDT